MKTDAVRNSQKLRTAFFSLTPSWLVAADYGWRGWRGIQIQTRTIAEQREELSNLRQTIRERHTEWAPGSFRANHVVVGFSDHAFDPASECARKRANARTRNLADSVGGEIERIAENAVRRGTTVDMELAGQAVIHAIARVCEQYVAIDLPRMFADEVELP